MPAGGGRPVAVTPPRDGTDPSASEGHSAAAVPPVTHRRDLAGAPSILSGGRAGGAAGGMLGGGGRARGSGGVGGVFGSRCFPPFRGGTGAARVGSSGVGRCPASSWREAGESGGVKL